MNYKDISIEEAEMLYDKLQFDIIYDADKQEIIFENILEEFINNFRDGLLNAFGKVISVAKDIVKVIVQAYNNIKEYVIKLYNKKISKKKFIKLLQSTGMQRNDISKLIKDNKEEYTIWRYLQSIPPHFW